jgi:hypothetical protein
MPPGMRQHIDGEKEGFNGGNSLKKNLDIEAAYPTE